MTAACASTAPVVEHDVSDSHRAWVDGVLAGDVTGFERDVLEDYWVTDEEYAQAQDLFWQCLEPSGFMVIFEDGQSTVVPETSFWSEYGSPDLAQAAPPLDSGVRMAAPEGASGLPLARGRAHCRS